MSTPQQKQAARVLATMTSDERISLLAVTESEELHAAERAKSHPITNDKFTAQEKAQLKLHLLDGGGVKDDAYLRPIVLQAILDDDWDTFFRELPHVVKSWVNLREDIVTAVGGAVMIHGFGPTPKPGVAPKG